MTETKPPPESEPQSPAASPAQGGFARAGSTLRLPGVRPFFASNFIQFLTGQIAMLAMQWLVTDLTESRLLISLVAFAQGGTIFVMSPFGGVIADRVSKRLLLILGRLALVVILLTMGSLVWIDQIEIVHVLLCSVVGGVAMAIVQPATQTFVFDLVGRDRLENAIALNATASGIAQVLGPAVGGALLAGFGVAATFMGAGLGMFSAAGLLIAIPVAGRIAETARKPAMSELKEGFAFAWRDYALRLVLIGCCMALFNGALAPMRPIYARFVLGVGEVGLGGMGAASGAGTILAAVALASLSRFRYVGIWITGSMFVFALGVLLYSFAFSYEYILLIEFLLGASGQVWNVTVIAGLQLAVPSEMRGRIVALIFMIAQLGFLGQPVVGALADRVGDQIALGIFGAIPSVILAGILVLRLNVLKEVGEARKPQYFSPNPPQL